VADIGENGIDIGPEWKGVAGRGKEGV